MTHEKVVPRQLDARASKWIEAQLSAGGSLSRTLAELGWGRSRVAALLPGEIDEAAAYSFDDAIPRWQEYQSSGDLQVELKHRIGTSEVIERLRSLLMARADAVCLLEDLIARPTDSVVADAPDVAFIGDTVVRFVTHSDLKDQSLRDPVGTALKKSTSFALTAVVTAASATLLARTQLTHDDLRELLRGSVVVVVLAYDGEGYLMAFPS